MLATIYLENQEYTSLESPEESLAKGSSFNNLYFPYKFITNKILKGKNPRQNLLALIDIYAFLITDLTMFITTHPKELKAKEDVKVFKQELKKLKELYNTNFSPLTLDDIGKEDFMVGPWPWEDRF